MYSQSVKSIMKNRVKYGIIAGLIATWSISTAIAASEFELGLPISTFYAIIGVSIGDNDLSSAAYLGFGLHLLTGGILGMIIGIASSFIAVKVPMNPYKSLLMGIGTGIGVWLVLFLPVTVLLVQPAIDRIALLLADREVFPGDMSQAIVGISLSAIAFHIIWGAIFGYVFSSLARIKAYRLDLAKDHSLA